MTILPVFSRIFKKFLQKQLLVFFDNILPNCQCGFQKGYDTQICLSIMLEVFKNATDKKNARSIKQIY